MPNYMAAQQDNERKRQPLTNLASLPGIKTPAQYDFGFASGAPRAQIQELASLAFIDRAANVVLLGLSGGGKTSRFRHRTRSDRRRLRELFTRTSELVQKLQVARQSLLLPSMLTKLNRFYLVILDDLSYVRKDQAETSVLFELIAERYERRSFLVTAQTINAG